MASSGDPKTFCFTPWAEIGKTGMEITIRKIRNTTEAQRKLEPILGI
jgi:hypothetical protein